MDSAGRQSRCQVPSSSNSPRVDASKHTAAPWPTCLDAGGECVDHLHAVQRRRSTRVVLHRKLQGGRGPGRRAVKSSESKRPSKLAATSRGGFAETTGGTAGKSPAHLDALSRIGGEVLRRHRRCQLLDLLHGCVAGVLHGVEAVAPLGAVDLGEEGAGEAGEASINSNLSPGSTNSSSSSGGGMRSRPPFPQPAPPMHLGLRCLLAQVLHQVGGRGPLGVARLQEHHRVDAHQLPAAGRGVRRLAA